MINGCGTVQSGVVEHTDGQRWQKDCKRKFTKLEEHQVRVTGREKLQGGISFIWWTLPPFFFALSLMLAYLDFQRSILTGVLIAGRGVHQLFKFYSQGEFTSKLPGPDGQIKGSGKTVQIIP